MQSGIIHVHELKILDTVKNDFTKENENICCIHNRENITAVVEQTHAVTNPYVLL